MSPLRMLLFRLSSDYTFLLRFLADPKSIYAAYHLTPDEVARVEQRSPLWPLLLGGTPAPSRALQTPEAPTAKAGVTALLSTEDDDDGENGGGENGGGGGGDDDDDDDDDHPPQPQPPQEPPPQPQPPQGPPLQPWPLPSLWPPLLEPPLIPPLPVGPAMLPPQLVEPPPQDLPPIYYGPIAPPPPVFPPLPNHLTLQHLGGKLKSISSSLSEKAVSLAKAARTTSGQDRLNNVRALIKEL
ncbi:MAG: hypothetical protein WBX16_26790 [Candidatus Acidiferrales bacterium]